MGITEQILAALLLGILGYAVYLLVVAARTPPDEPGARFRSGWLGTFGLQLGLASCMGLAAVLAVYGAGSAAAVVAAVIINVVVQPVALLICWAGIRKIALGLQGQVAYAWRRVPDAELADLPPGRKRQLSWFCVAQGVVVLPLGVVISLGCALVLATLLGA
jgi:hypothetical protein